MKLSIITGALLLVLSVSSCGSNNSSFSGKRLNVTLKIHAWEGYVEEHRDEFKKFALEKYNLDVELKTTKASGLDSFIKSVREEGAHLISPAHDFLAPLLRAKVIRPIDKNRIKKFNQINPVILKRKAYELEGKVYAVPYNFGPYAIAYNKDKMEAPRSYKVLWSAKNRKKVSIPNTYPTINIYMAALMLDIPKKDLFNLNNRQLTKIENQLRILCKRQVGEYWEGNLNPKSHKKIDIGMDWGIAVTKINQEHKGNWGFVIPEEGATGWVDNWVMTTNVKDKDVETAAYIWMDYMLSPKVQAKMARITSYGPINPYSGRHLTAEEKTKFYLADPNFMDKIILWQPLSDTILKKYQKTWERAIK